ncbi:MAG: S8 family serine peptidase, partial [Bdellovibrionales bacterium]|nr:S8 family serine peptidase [Bdellovibrionales bacterium]
SGFEVLFGGHPGHGTHVAGCVAARADNGKGIVGVAPNVKIMAMRFLTEDGQGTLEGAIDSIKYASDMGAQILNNSWGSEGDGGDAATSKALTDAIQYSQDAGALFVASAGNGRQGVGYDNDSDSKPAFPASYPNDNILSVAALDSSDQLGSFSNWGRNTVDIGAPGVKVYSTVPDNVYQDTVIDIPGFITATWDGTSMASPHVAGAAALYLSKNPNADWRELKQVIMDTATPIPAMNGKAVSNGKLNVKALMQ